MNISICTADIRSEVDVMLTRQRARQIADLFDFDRQDQSRIATAVSEIARNAYQHAGGGRVEFRLLSGAPQSLQILVKDNGPGIADVDGILNFRGSLPTDQGESLRGVRRLVDVFEIKTAPGKGTVVTLSKRRSRQLPTIEQADMARITAALTRGVSDDPLIEMQRQNQELLHTLEELRIQQEDRTKHLKEIETLNFRLKRSIQATHHRVKNNLQIISALVDLQIDTDADTVPIEAMIRIGRHSRSLAALHDMLTHDTEDDAEAELISAKEALCKWIILLQATTGGRNIVYTVDDFWLPVKESGSLALLVTELISNAIKHGTNDIDFALTVKGSTATLVVANDGPGFPPEFDWRKAANIGLGIIDSTGRHDLRGIINYENRTEGGARVVVTFPVHAHDLC